MAQLCDALEISDADAQRISKKIWQNECNGTVSGLTSWNADEDFASLGIGHFIWYPSGKRGPFEESFPKLVSFLSARGVKLPATLSREKGSCPWNSRAEFLAAKNNAEMNQLRHFLAATVPLQARFMVERLDEALPAMLAEAPAANRELLQKQFSRVASSAQGCYALVDFVNFKGEGVLHSERYHGEGWGLLQALQTMRVDDGAPANVVFARATAAVLRRRVANSPPSRHEAQWLPGWLNRVATYGKSSL